MIERFQGDEGRRRLIAALTDHRLVAGDAALAERLVATGELIEVPAGQTFIEQAADTTDVYFIVAGSVDILVNRKQIAIRHAGEHVGEMSAVEPTQSRAATATARELCVLLKVSEPNFAEAADAHPRVWRRLAAVMAKRLAQRNSLITTPRERVRVFVMSSAEALPVTRLIVQHFEHDPFLAVVWNHGVFKASNYTLEDLENELDDSDFAIAVAHADDVVISRENEWPAVRDNVIFELGMFIGRLGRRRSFLMEPRGAGVKLPSDLAGLTTIPYRYVPGKDAMAEIAPACDRLRELILASGARN